VTPIPTRQHHSAQTNQDAARFSTVDAQAAKPIALRPSSCLVPPIALATMIHGVAVGSLRMARPATGNRISGPGVIGTAYHGPEGRETPLGRIPQR
jgi:hypothetical protein